MPQATLALFQSLIFKGFYCLQCILYKRRSRGRHQAGRLRVELSLVHQRQHLLPVPCQSAAENAGKWLSQAGNNSAYGKLCTQRGRKNVYSFSYPYQHVASFNITRDSQNNCVLWRCRGGTSSIDLDMWKHTNTFHLSRHMMVVLMTTATTCILMQKRDPRIKNGHGNIEAFNMSLYSRIGGIS